MPLERMRPLSCVKTKNSTVEAVTANPGLVLGATAVIQQALRSGKASPWLAELLKRKPAKLAAVALANKMARIA